MRIAAAAVLLCLAWACAANPGAGGPGVAGGLAGSWQLVQVNARPLPVASPEEPNVTIERGALTLEPGGTFVLQLQARVSAAAEPTSQTVRGSYRVEGDTLALTPDDPGVAAPASYRFVREGAMLRLRDEKGTELAFSRR